MSYFRSIEHSPYYRATGQACEVRGRARAKAWGGWALVGAHMHCRPGVGGAWACARRLAVAPVRK